MTNSSEAKGTYSKQNAKTKTRRATRADDGKLDETKRSANAVDACVTMMLGNVSGGLLCKCVH